MARKLVNMRLDEGLLARVDAVAGPRKRTEFTERALERVLSEALSTGEAVPDAGRSAPTRAPVEKEQDRDPAERTTLREPATPTDKKPESRGIPSRPAFNCPVTGCDFRAFSPKAVCGRHGRTVR